MDEQRNAGPEGSWEDRDALDARTATRGYMVARSLAGPASAAYVLYGMRSPPPAFWIIFAVAHVLGFVAVGVAFSGSWRVLRPELTLPLDVVVLTALLALSGGAQSELRNMVLVLMVAPAIVMSARVVALTGLAMLFAYGLVALPDLAQGEPRAGEAIVTFVVGLVWVTGTAVVLSRVRATVAERVAVLLQGRRVLLGGVLDLEARERRRITRDLHEGALQHLLAVRQDLEEASADPDALDRAEMGVRVAIDQLRDTIADVHPVALDHGGLAAALRAIGERAAVHGGFTVDVAVDPAAEGLRDDVLVNVARELIGNAADHAGASRLDVWVIARPTVLMLEVSDDGVGFDPDAMRAGAVGLAACAERVAAADGFFRLNSAPGEGTSVHVVLPRRPELERRRTGPADMPSARV